MSFFKKLIDKAEDLFDGKDDDDKKKNEGQQHQQQQGMARNQTNTPPPPAYSNICLTKALCNRPKPRIRR